MIQQERSLTHCSNSYLHYHDSRQEIVSKGDAMEDIARRIVASSQSFLLHSTCSFLKNNESRKSEIADEKMDLKVGDLSMKLLSQSARMAHFIIILLFDCQIDGKSCSSVAWKDKLEGGGPTAKDRYNLDATTLMSIEKRLKALMKDGKWGGVKRGELRRGFSDYDDEHGQVTASDFKSVARKLDIPLERDEVSVSE
jgi:hypothetical protein